MKKKSLNIKIPLLSIALLAASFVALFWSDLSAYVQAEEYGVEFLIGVSQCNLAEPYRAKMNADIAKAAEAYPNIKVIFTDAAQSNEKQISDIQYLVDSGIDLLIVSPNQSEPLTEAVAQAYDKVPVIVLDRELSGDEFSLFIGADNYAIGKQCAKNIVAALGEAGGNIIEITGLVGSAPAVLRSNGFYDEIARHPQFQIVASINADWLRDESYDRLFAWCQDNPDICVDAIYSQNDPMALGARWVMDSFSQHPAIVGIDGLPGKGNGIELVKQGTIYATCVYPTCGPEAIEYALKILNGEKLEEKYITLPFENVTQSTKNTVKNEYNHDTNN